LLFDLVFQAAFGVQQLLFLFFQALFAAGYVGVFCLSWASNCLRVAAINGAASDSVKGTALLQFGQVMVVSVMLWHPSLSTGIDSDII
jgi:hypothetical protein